LGYIPFLKELSNEGNFTHPSKVSPLFHQLNSNLELRSSRPDPANVKEPIDENRPSDEVGHETGSDTDDGLLSVTTSTGRKKPDSQMHASEEGDPAGEVECFGHAVHVPSPARAKVFLGHLEHTIFAPEPL